MENRNDTNTAYRRTEESKKELLENTSFLLCALSSHALPTILTTGEVKTPPTSKPTAS